ncbi:aldehyde dehydrogenase family protein [Piscinibacter gummiphilus]|uniref:aldehyde dehydrogenase (NAD(+)) n=1 Tax=Piscinibacter gummiphilus TaxID=946333 RepID=A0A1W6LBV1_9BURK|nr:aldehyde dehydrogenase family protein [Piscinibacter gummiphilus]ARN21732.1 aldehyde dehydrogenase [Piscinibacter gummiphilus]ATU66418.1 aldehyde dehydrogenase family protein [Piscinibacter gummiphilus]GLS95695.1 aldehyde dehydrogenase [Piscinibacter gummiphilus]
MRHFDHAYIGGRFVPVLGTETLQTLDPTTERVIGTATLANREDARRAIAAARDAQRTLGRTTKAERISMLKRLQAAVLARTDDIRDATLDEYGGPLSRARWVSQYASQSFANAIAVLEDYDFVRQVGHAEVVMEPVGVSALIVPWNSVAGTMCSKLASALAAGCASIIKPSEFSPLQTRVVAETFHDADLPPGVVNVLLGRGGDVGDELSTNPDVARISFTGSTPTGKLIARAAVDTMKRVSLALTGKSATVLLDDADFRTTVPLALNAAFMNNGQACVAGTRLLVPRARQAEVLDLVRQAVAALRVGNPRDPETAIGPMASRAQYDRIQHYIRLGLEEGATLVTGGEGRPQGLDAGWFVKPTVFADVHGGMAIARDEIFGPVLSILAYDDEDDAVRIANDSAYGLQAYVFSSQPERARRVAMRLDVGSVLINRIAPDVLAPLGGTKQSGVGRELGRFGFESFLEPKALVTD